MKIKLNAYAIAITAGMALSGCATTTPAVQHTENPTAQTLKKSDPVDPSQPFDIERLKTARSVEVIIYGGGLSPVGISGDFRLKKNGCSISTDTPDLLNKFIKILSTSSISNDKTDFPGDSLLGLYYQYKNGDQDKFLFAGWNSSNKTTTVSYSKNNSDKYMNFEVPSPLIFKNFSTLYSFCTLQDSE